MFRSLIYELSQMSILASVQKIGYTVSGDQQDMLVLKNPELQNCGI